MTHPENSNQPDPDEISAVLCDEHEGGRHEARIRLGCPDCPMPSVPPMPSTVHNLHNQQRMIT
jgi:hypothetical protein